MASHLRTHLQFAKSLDVGRYVFTESNGGMNSFRYRTQPGAFLERRRTRSRNHQGPGDGCGSDGNLDGNEHFERTARCFCLNGVVPCDASQDTSLSAAILTSA